MKTRPSYADVEAAQLFSPAGGMRAGWRGERNGALFVWERLADGTIATPDFYDTDDPATVGCMLAQVRAASGHPCLHVVAGEPDLDGSAWWSAPRRFTARSALGRTEGAALVAAMRALAATRTNGAAP